jgi:hypothetical protein
MKEELESHLDKLLKLLEALDYDTEVLYDFMDEVKAAAYEQGFRDGCVEGHLESIEEGK